MEENQQRTARETRTFSDLLSPSLTF